jgi:hypothetical protein
VTVTTSAGETISNLMFSDSSGAALDGDVVAGMHTLDGGNVYLWSSGDFCIATTSATAGAGRIVAAFYLNEAANHLSAQVQMVTFEPLQHPVTTDPDDALNFTDVLQVSAQGTLSFNFDNLASGNFLWAAVGSGSAGLMVTGQDLNVNDTANKLGEIVTGGSTDPSDAVNTSQGGIGATIGINSQHFVDASGGGSTRVDGATGVFTLVKGFVPLNNAAQATGTNVNQINYDDYINAPSAKIFVSQVTGSSSIGGAVRVTLWEAGGGGSTDHLTTQLHPEEGYSDVGSNQSYIGNQDTDSHLRDDTPVLVGGVTITRGANTYTFSGSGGTQAGITVAISSNGFTVTGLVTSDTIGFAAANDPNNPLDGTFNRFDVQALANSNPVDIGRIDLDQGVSVTHAVGDQLVVQDDGPSIVADPTNAPSITDDDSFLNVNNSGDYSGNFTATFGTDGPGATAKSYSLSTAGGDSGLIESGTGLHVFLFKVGDNIVGKSGADATAAASGTTVFVVSIDQNGVVTLDQQRAVVHDPNTSVDQSTTLMSAGLVVVNATATDGDGDHASDSLNIGQLLNFKDDAPTITAQILGGSVAFATGATGTVSHSLNGSVGGDINNASSQSLSGAMQYTITSFDAPHTVYANLNGVLSADGTSVTYYSDLADTNAVYQLSLNQTANSGAGSYTFTVLQPPPIVQTNFDFTDLPSGQNLFGIIATDKAHLDKGGLLCFPSNPDLAADGTMTNVSGTINTSKGGGPVTIGNGNQAFDDPSEGAYFMYVDNPTAAGVGGLSLTQTSADDADTINFDSTNAATRASVEIVQASGAGTAKRPGPAMHITCYDTNPGHVDTASEARTLVNNPTLAAANQGTAAPEVNIIGIKIHDSTGAVIEYRTLDQATGAAVLQDSGDAGTAITGADDSAVGIQFILDNAHGAGTADDVYSAVVSNLSANYTVEFITGAVHDLALVQNVSGSYDLGGFNVFNQTDVAAQDFHFSAQINDYDNDAYGGSAVTFANWTVHVNDIVFP